MVVNKGLDHLAVETLSKNSLVDKKSI